jgi:hypothetical protein
VIVTSPLSRGAISSRSYFAASRAPRYSVLFALPLLIGYQALALLLEPPGRPQLRNGADVLLQSLFIAAAGSRGPAVFITCVVLLGAGLVAWDLRRSRERLRLSVFVWMAGEAVALALIFGLVIGLATSELLGSLHSLATGAAAPSPSGHAGLLALLQRGSAAPTGIAAESWPMRLMMSLGAGLYEELFFRVILVGGIAAGGRVVLGLSRRAAGIIAVVLGALVFSAFHYIGPYGDAFTVQSFVFRALSGVAFSGLYLLRGFGITAWTHALYDAFLLLG